MSLGGKAGRNVVRSLAVAVVALGLAGCGNNPEKAQGWGALLTAYDDQRDSRAAKKSAGSAEAQAGKANAVQMALAANKGPMMLAVLEEKQRTAILGWIGENGPYRTWQTSSRQTMSTRSGVLTGTRGLGYDLLSADVSQSLSLISGRRAGTSQRVYRHITGENHERSTVMTCEIAPAGSDKVILATGQSFSATIMKETCRAEDLKVRNTYWVTGAGRIVQSVQWISPEVGKVALQSLRD